MLPLSITPDTFQQDIVTAMLLGADFHSRFPNGLTFHHPDSTYRCSFKEPFESRPFGSIHKRFSCTRVDGECSIPGPLSICPSDLVLDGQCYRSTPLRQAGLLHCWRCRNGGLQHAHVDRTCPTSDTPGKQGNPPEHNLLAGDFSLASFRIWLCRRFLSADRTSLKY